MASETAVADGETFGMPASSRIGTAVFDSPENAGPTMPTTLSVSAFLAWLVAWVGSPWVSYLISLTWVTPDLALCCSRASSTPLEMLMPSCAFGPVCAFGEIAVVTARGHAFDHLLLEGADSAHMAESCHCTP